MVVQYLNCIFYFGQKVNQQDDVLEVQGCLMVILSFSLFQKSLQQQYKLFSFY